MRLLLLASVLGGLAVSVRSAAAATPDTGSADRRPPTDDERRTCEHINRLMEEPDPLSDRQVTKCVSLLLRSDWFRSPGEEAEYARWLDCRLAADSPGGGKACEAILHKHLRTTPAAEGAAFEREHKQRVRRALAALERFRGKGLSAQTLKQTESAARGPFSRRWIIIFEDAAAVLAGGRVRPGTDLAIYPHLGSGGVPRLAAKGERAGDLAFDDPRSGKRVVRFSQLSVGGIQTRIDDGDLATALAWVAEKPDARRIEVAVDGDAKSPARVLLAPAFMKEIEARLGTHLPKGLERIPFLVQGDTSISYERWLALAEEYRARGLDREEDDSPKLAGLATLSDLERVLAPAPPSTGAGSSLAPRR